MWTGKFWKQSIERAIKTAAQTAAGLLAGEGMGLLTVDWGQIGGVAGMAALVSLLTSIGSSTVGDKTPSLVE